MLCGLSFGPMKPANRAVGTASSLWSRPRGRLRAPETASQTDRKVRKDGHIGPPATPIAAADTAEQRKSARQGTVPLGHGPDLVELQVRYVQQPGSNCARNRPKGGNGWLKAH